MNNVVFHDFVFFISFFLFTSLSMPIHSSAFAVYRNISNEIRGNFNFTKLAHRLFLNSLISFIVLFVC